ncbi:MAG: Smr/MutS family protein [Burkholderiales bacterium]|nr:Smr/MutS family protein [Burkholderiales bacterium]
MPLPTKKLANLQDALDHDAAAFRRAVADVTPAPPVRQAPHRGRKPAPIPAQTLLDQKQVLIDSLSDEDPWLAGFETGDELCFLRPGLPPNILKRLRRGHWIIQDEVDLHGLTKVEARIRMAEFLNAAMKAGHRCVRIIHGKGLGSKNREPVLKHKVRIWLAQRDEVMAFCQARPTDGGSGAAVVLLKSSG